ncbi:MAG: dehydrogenase [Cyanobacteria bacterium MAG CAR3_bin_5]|nr:dehydrogenase [Cyanobacteria bacterium MAG CAR3_bin_5]
MPHSAPCPLTQLARQAKAAIYSLLLINPVLLAQPLLASETLPSTVCEQFPTIAVDTGKRSEDKDWQGTQQLSPTVSILVLAGHADLQTSGTNGQAVADGADPMQPGMTDEAFWNLATAQRIARLGRQRGLNIFFYDPFFYDPVVRHIPDNDAPRTNWSTGKRHVEAGGYALEIHYNAYSPDGTGSGIIPRVHEGQTVIDEYLASEFGAFPLDFRRGNLGAPRRGITILEVGNLEGDLEEKLRDTATRDRALNAIADRIVTAIEKTPIAKAIGACSTPLPTR